MACSGQRDIPSPFVGMTIHYQPGHGQPSVELHVWPKKDCMRRFEKNMIMRGVSTRGSQLSCGHELFDREVRELNKS